MSQAFARHLETYLGPFRRQFTATDPGGEGFPFVVHEFPDQPWPGATSYVTLGLQEVPLKQPDGSLIRHELMFSVEDRFAGEACANLVFHAGAVVLERCKSIAQGWVLDLSRPLVPGASGEGFFFYDPIYFPESFGRLEERSPPTVLAWMVPLTRAEISFIAAHGSEAFDQLMAEQDPQVLDLKRRSLKWGR